MWDLKQSMPQDAMSWAVVGKLQSSDEGDEHREAGGGDVEIMTWEVMMYRVRKVRPKVRSLWKRVLRPWNGKYI